MKNNQPGKSSLFRQDLLSLTLCFGVLLMPQISLAASATEVHDTSEKAVEVSITSQANLESWVEEEHRLLEEIEDLEHLLDHTRWQRKKLSIYKDDLSEKIIGLKERAEAMKAVNMELLPILEKNLEKLQTVVDTDRPCDLTQRRKSLHHARTVLNDYDMGLLDKTRVVLDATAREVDLGHQVKVQEDEIEINGKGRRVKMLQVGRVGLYAMTLDSEKAYQWDVPTSKWTAIEEDIASIHEAIEMAEGIRLVGLSKLPLAQPTTLERQGAAAQ